MSKCKAGEIIPDIFGEVRDVVHSHATNFMNDAELAGASITPSFSHVDRLATVELQLIMQHCDKVSLLRLARCNRMTLAAASHPFAWRSSAPLPMKVDRLSVIAAQISTSLLRFADVALAWRPMWSEAPHEDTDDDVAVVAVMPRLRSLHVAGPQSATGVYVMTDTMFATTIAAAGANSSLRTLTFDTIPMTNTKVAALANALIHNGNLTKLDVGFLFISHNAMSLLTRGIQSNRSLRWLRLSGNHVGAASAQVLAAAMTNTLNLTHVYLDACGIGDVGAVALITALEQCNLLHTLSLSNNNVGPDSVTALVSLINQCHYLNSLELDENQLGPEDIIKLAATLHTDSTLCQMSLWGMGIGSTGALALADAIRRGWSPEQLYLDGTYRKTRTNPIGDDGAIALADALQHRGPSLPLQFLSLARSRLSDQGVVALLRAAHCIPTLRSINLRNNIMEIPQLQTCKDAALTLRIARPNIILALETF